MAVLGASVRVVLQQAPATGKPAVRAAGLVAHQQAETKPERAADGPTMLMDLAMRVVGPFERIEIVLVPPDQICRLGQQFEVFGCQRGFLVGHQKRMVGIGPGALLESPARGIKLIALTGDDTLPLARVLAHALLHPNTNR